MKSFAVLMAVGLAAVAQAQDQCVALAAGIPTCAVTCLQSAASSVGCDATDFACQCKPANTQKINSSAMSCVLKACGATKGLQVQSSASAVCACAATAAGGAAPTSAAAAPSSSVASPTSAADAANSAAPATSSAAPDPTTSAAAAPAGSNPSSSSTNAVSSSSSTAPSTGAAIKTIISVGGIMGALLALITML